MLLMRQPFPDVKVGVFVFFFTEMPFQEYMEYGHKNGDSFLLFHWVGIGFISTLKSVFFAFCKCIK